MSRSPVCLRKFETAIYRHSCNNHSNTYLGNNSSMQSFKNFSMKYAMALLLLVFQSSAWAQSDKPVQDWPNLLKYTQANAALMQQPVSKNRVIFMGNSIFEFWSVRDSSYFVQHPNYVNRGISGQTTPQMLLRFRQDVIDLKPAAVVILAGINDIAENTGPIPLTTTMGNIASMAELAGVHHIKVILCSVLPTNHFSWRSSIYPADKVIALNAMIKAYAQQHRLTYVNFYDPMVDGEKGLQTQYTLDGVHPNITGYTLMGQLVDKAIKATLANKP
jgi:lysophospholipase L1-like esterase